MGTEELTIRLKPTAEDYRRVLFRSSRRAIIPVFVVLFFLAFTCVFAVSRSQPKDPGDGRRPAIIAAAALVPILFVALICWGIRRQANKLSEIAEETRLTFSDSGIESNSASASARVNWERYQKIVETKTDFLLYPQGNLVVPIPKSTFAAEEQIAVVRSLIANKLGPKAKLIG